MSPWKRLLLHGYFAATYPGRMRCLARLARDGRSPVLVLFYHRIADDRATPWTAPFATFERQLRWLGRHFDLVSLTEAQRRIRAGHNERPSATITFDDGYAENCDRALPLLIERRIPCTYFVCSQHVATGSPFAHDLALGYRLAPNTPEQIRELARAGIDIGAHTRTHADLGQIDDPGRLHEELVGARDELEQICGAAVRYFAFPFGLKRNMSPAAFRLARQAGYLGVCSAYGGFNFPGDDAFHIQRVHGDDEMARFKNLALVDPWRQGRVKRYCYEMTDRTVAPSAEESVEVST